MNLGEGLVDYLVVYGQPLIEYLTMSCWKPRGQTLSMESSEEVSVDAATGQKGLSARKRKRKSASSATAKLKDYENEIPKAKKVLV